VRVVSRRLRDVIGSAEFELALVAATTTTVPIGRPFAGISLRQSNDGHWGLEDALAVTGAVKEGVVVQVGKFPWANRYGPRTKEGRKATS
jgi:hypothetical protein